MIDGVLYVTTPYNSIAALDAETGRELWRFDGEAYKLGQILSSSGWKLRGTAFWRDGNKLRVFLNSRHRMFSLEAEDGRPVRSFGDAGVVSLTDGLARISDIKHATQSSPPVVYRDLVIVGSQIPDRVQSSDPVGYVQAFNARTGKRAWTFSVIPQSAKDPGAETWENESWRKNGHANVWAPMALDAARGLLYLPTSTPSSDYYGGGRPGANLFAESLVCLDAATGKMKWHFQTVHHGLWDYDNPAQPNLVTITVNGRRIDAVAQITKQGFTYVFDRVTGQPVWPIVERPVPTDSNVPGERAVPDAAVSHQAAAVYRSGRLARRREQPDAGNQDDGAGADEEVPDRPALHAAVARRDAAAPGAGRRRQLGRRGIRSRDGLSLRASHARRSASTGWRRTTDPIRSSKARTRTDSRAAAKGSP